jgi:hypothetical protein
MNRVVRIPGLLTFVILAGTAIPLATAQEPQASPASIVIVFKDGHQETFSMSDIERIDFKTTAATIGNDDFLGKWEAGDGSGGTFVISLESNGEASKSIGASHGIWTVVGDEARISWDDGWHDALRKIGDKHEKFAFAPGTTFSQKPENVTAAHKLESAP